MDYVSKWVEAIVALKNYANMVVQFLQKNILTYCGAQRAIVSDEGTHLCNKVFAALMAKYRVHHKKALSYHPQSNEQAEITNREIKRILEKTVGINIKYWAMRLNNSLWAY